MKRTKQTAFTLLEMLAAITIIAIIAAVVMPRISIQAFGAKGKVCDQYVSDINAAVENYYLGTGSFPTSVSDLSPTYYPDVVPICPVTGLPYDIDPTTNRVIGHSH